MTFSDPLIQPQTTYNRLNPFSSKILARSLLNKEGSSKATFHVSLDISDSNMLYKPGDALGIYPENDENDISILLSKLGCRGDELVCSKRTKESLALHEFLQKHANLQKVTQKISDCLGVPHDLAHDVISASLAMKSPLNDVQAFCDALLPIAPRFYSIASSMQSNPNQVDLLVATFTYHHGYRFQEGLGSSYICKKAVPFSTQIRVFVHPNDSFTLPQDDSKPIIMIGPGTGVAPFRAFLQERQLKGSLGKNWLFFGERNSHSDFYYEDFFKDLERKSFLRLSTAFSRDQEEKYYVQDAMRAHAKELYLWIKEGAIIYLCGDAKNMAKDVMATLSEILCEEGSMTLFEAEERLKSMRKEGLLFQDIY